MSEKEQLIKELTIKLQDLLHQILDKKCKYDSRCNGFEINCNEDNEKIFCTGMLELDKEYDYEATAYEIYIEKKKIKEIRENTHMLYVAPEGLEIREGKKYVVFRVEPGFQSRAMIS